MTINVKKFCNELIKHYKMHFITTHNKLKKKRYIFRDI